MDLIHWKIIIIISHGLSRVIQKVDTKEIVQHYLSTAWENLKMIIDTQMTEDSVSSGLNM